MLSLYFVCGTSNCPNGDLIRTLENALKGGVNCFQFREKGPNAMVGQEKEELAKQLHLLCQTYHVPFIIDDDIDLVKKLDADGLHIGQKDISVQEARQQIGNKILGLSVNNLEEYEKSEIDLLDYISVGPYHSTQSKVDAQEAVGTSSIQAIRQVNQSLPIVAIGGIGQNDIEPIIKAGANGIAVISAIARSKEIEQTCKSFRSRLDLALKSE